jgi:predicted RND superfamily exporter protein
VLSQVKDEVMFSTMICVVAIACLLLLVYQDLALTLMNVVVACSGLVVVPAWLYTQGFHINHATLVNLVPLVGIGLDCTIHLSMAYLHQVKHGEPDQNPVETSMINTIPGILLGQLTTLMPIFCMMGLNSYILRAFWNVWLGMVVMNTYFGMTLLPMMIRFRDWSSKQTSRTPVCIDLA